MKHLKDNKSGNLLSDLNLKQFPVLPDINKQIAYVQHLRKDVIPVVKPLRGEIVMVFAIEQSLLAAKRYEQSKSKSDIENDCQRILNTFKISITTIRLEVLKAILSRGSNEFTISEIHLSIPGRRRVSKPAVTAALDLFKTRGIVHKSSHPPDKKGPGRPEEKFKYQFL